MYAAHDPTELTDADLDVDHMEEVSQMLSAEADDAPDGLAPAFKQFRYDLCPDCHAKFLRDPLNKEVRAEVRFQRELISGRARSAKALAATARC